MNVAILVVHNLVLNHDPKDRWLSLHSVTGDAVSPALSLFLSA